MSNTVLLTDQYTDQYTNKPYLENIPENIKVQLCLSLSILCHIKTHGLLEIKIKKKMFLLFSETAPTILGKIFGTK